MSLQALTLRWQNYRRFRSVSRRAAETGFGGYLAFLRECAGAFGLLFDPGAPLLGDSKLRGSYDGLAVEIGLVAEEIRVVTTFRMELPGPPRPEALALIEEPGAILERWQSLRAASAVRLREAGEAGGAGLATLKERLDALETQQIFWSSGWLSQTTVTCDVRYLQRADEVGKVLLALTTIARTLTQPT
jgi:hypothetical protein